MHAWTVVAALSASIATPSAIVAPTDPSMSSTADPVRAQQDVEVDGALFRLALVVQGKQAALLIRNTRGQDRFWMIQETDDALVLLSDRRLSRLWPALLDWAGTDLAKLRDREVAEAREAYARGVPARFARTTAESTTRPRVRALLQYASALERAGHDSEAVALLRQALSTMGRKSDWERDERSGVTLRVARILHSAGDTDGALAALRDGESDLAGSAYAINFPVNRAAYLAEAGRYTEALAAVDQAQRAFAATRKQGPGAIPGSERHYAWIRACALHGLGREGEAQTALANGLSDDEPSDRSFKLDSNVEIRLRAFACERDVDGAVSLLVPIAASHPLASQLLMLQPAYRSPSTNADYLQRVRDDLRMKAATAAWLQPLPDPLVPALNHWRVSRAP